MPHRDEIHEILDGSKLLTPEDLRTLPEIKGTEADKDPLVRIKFFTPWSNWTWFVTEGEAEEGDVRFFGYVEGLENELGYFMLSELESVRGPGGLRIERDLYFTPAPLSKFMK